MAKIIAIVIIAALGWCFYTGKINLNFNEMKENSIETLKNEKTIKAVNSSRDKRQEDINRILNNN